MANALYNKARENYLTAQSNWLVGTYKLVLLRESYTFNPAHEHLSDIAAGDRVAVGLATLSNRTATNGKAGSDDVVLTTLPIGEVVGAVAIFQDTGDEATSDLIAYIDDARGLPFTSTDGDTVFQWDQVNNAIFQL